MRSVRLKLSSTACGCRCAGCCCSAAAAAAAALPLLRAAAALLIFLAAAAAIVRAAAALPLLLTTSVAPFTRQNCHSRQAREDMAAQHACPHSLQASAQHSS
ncbi:hypothetical protein JKP88DRAFT_234983 [Tribonema minus]|uniref:Uncharacterized protein n=1 Tax=Tribonema minus TaxID=303371 RepID=A0A836CJF7_9STRA|nr:hypothetical protein JKP88DRAFT_234983 [Tribonema minus]